MLAVIEPIHGGYVARFERIWKHPVAEVWAFLTNNEKLVKWFPELKARDLREGGFMQFDMPNGMQIDMKITDFQAEAVLAYEWAEDHVRFELQAAPDGEGCQLVLIETLSKLTDHTPRDLAGWHVCLDVIEALLDGRTIERKEEWNKRYPEYVEALAKINRPT
ncbi:SRPBCC family protein [Paenibacillus hexagrammi]|uniref:SRPBCC family protein n=1 Tax=Paenibacillus hexagrammi TaxID=2908839 RepID=A0ABY3SHI7_9BACL|nr:SRPBCC family protein [Paenibacillus sp. YPD9-1]UJF32679.1 SRPBCC family protein [Paenibacillus sp. YPD9-1]